MRKHKFAALFATMSLCKDQVVLTQTINIFNSWICKIVEFIRYIVLKKIPISWHDEHVYKNISGLIDGINKNRSDKVNIKLRQFYDSCMDVDTIRTKGFIPGMLNCYRDCNQMNKITFINWSTNYFNKSFKILLIL